MANALTFKQLPKASLQIHPTSYKVYSAEMLNTIDE